MTYCIIVQRTPTLYYMSRDRYCIYATPSIEGAKKFNGPPDPHLFKLVLRDWPDAHVVEMQPEPVRTSPPFVDPLQAAAKRVYGCAGNTGTSEPVRETSVRDLAENYNAALRAVPAECREFGDRLPGAVAKLAKSYEASQAENETLKRRNAEGSEQVSALQDENAKLKAKCRLLENEASAHSERIVVLTAELSDAKLRLPSDLQDHGLTLGIIELCRRSAVAKPDPVADAEIHAVLDEMVHALNYKLNPLLKVEHWHDTLRAVGAEVVVARESLEQCKMALPEDLRGGSVVLGISALIRARKEAESQADKAMRSCIELERERDETGVAVRGLQGRNDELFKERDEARAKVNELDSLIGAKDRYIGLLKSQMESQSKEMLEDLYNTRSDLEKAHDKLDSIRKIVESHP